MPRHKLVPTLFVLLAMAAAARAGPPATNPADGLDGVWLVDAATAGKVDRVAFVWESQLKVAGRSFALSKFMDLKADLEGTFANDPANPKHLDVTSDGLDLSATGMPFRVPATTWLGLYERTGDRLRVSFDRKTGRRPSEFGETGDTIVTPSFAKAPAGFKAFPKEVAVKVVAPDGKPVSGATVDGYMHPSDDGGKKAAKKEWVLTDGVKTGEDGTAEVKYDTLGFQPVVARDAANHRMAVKAVSPASVAVGEVVVTLESECRVTWAVTCDALSAAGRPVGWTSVYVNKGGRRMAYFSAPDGGKFEFVLPPGEYSFYTYDGDVVGKEVPVTVPPLRSELVL